MKVAYQPGLEAMAGSLSGMGFEMAPAGSGQEMDAVIFTGGMVGLRFRPSVRGAFLLNVRGMSPAQAAQALRRRSQTQLF